MTIELVDPDKIEEIVGIKRDEHRHYGRAVSEEETVYILHSQHCVDSKKDLRYCYYSKALAEGIKAESWAHAFDRPVKIGIEDGLVVPIDIWKGQVG